MAILELDEREHKNIVEGSGLPPYFYSSPEILSRERKEIFEKSWQFAAHAAEVEAPGSYALARIGEFEVIVVRDQAGRLHAMRNVCLHRGAPLVDCAGRGTMFRCPYHAWTYNLDGTLRAAPGFEGHPRLKPGVSGLRPARLEEFGPFIFVNLDPDAGPLAEVVGPIQGALQQWRGVKHRETREYPYECNWKIAIENSLECYHCPVVHPEFNTLIDTQNYECEIFKFCATAGGSRRAAVAARGSRVYESATDAGAADVQTFYVWPNLWLLTYPGPANLVLARWLPQGLERSVCLRSFYFGDDFPEEKRPGFIEYVEKIQKQDLKICADVFRNISTGAFEHSFLRFGGGGLTEELIQQFHEWHVAALTRAP